MDVQCLNGNICEEPGSWCVLKAVCWLLCQIANQFAVSHLELGSLLSVDWQLDISRWNYKLQRVPED
jgi:hypothetical protein